MISRAEAAFTKTQLYRPAWHHRITASRWGRPTGLEPGAAFCPRATAFRARNAGCGPRPTPWRPTAIRIKVLQRGQSRTTVSSASRVAGERIFPEQIPTPHPAATSPSTCARPDMVDSSTRAAPPQTRSTNMKRTTTAASSSSERARLCAPVVTIHNSEPRFSQPRLITSFQAVLFTPANFSRRNWPAQRNGGTRGHRSGALEKIHVAKNRRAPASRKIDAPWRLPHAKRPCRGRRSSAEALPRKRALAAQRRRKGTSGNGPVKKNGKSISRKRPDLLKDSPTSSW